MRKIFFLFFIFLCPLLWRGAGNKAFSQDTLDNAIEQKLEDLAETSQNEEDDYSNLLEALNYYRKHPIRLNHTTTAALSELGLLNEFQIENLLSHIEKNGKLISVYELQSIDGFDLQTIKKIIPYIKVSDTSEDLHVTLKEIIKQGNHQFILRGQQILEEQKGYSAIDSAGIHNSPNSRYIGSPQKIYSRYLFRYGNNVSVGITAEKDAGELFFRNNSKHDYPFYDSLLQGRQKNGFDFYSAHFFIKNIRFIKALAIGDYQIGFGQGLTAWSGLAYGKTFDAVNIKRNAMGIRPYTSADENRFMRGAAITGGSDKIQVSGFLSRKKVDANITLTDSTNANEIISVSSLQETGMHSTPSEIANKDAISQTIFGGNISFRKRKYVFGITALHTLFDAEINRPLQPYNQFEFNGKQLTNLGADYSVLIHNFNFFGEFSASSNVGQVSNLSYLNGCIISLDPKLSLSLLHRNFQRNYQSLSANAFAENSKPANEQGFYSGIAVKPSNFISINAYYDHFVFPWLKYRIDAPSSGNEFLVQINYTPGKKFDTYIRFKQKDKFVNDDSPGEIDFITPFRQENYRWQIGYQISPSIKLRNRVEYMIIKTGTEDENGYLIYQDATYKKMGSKFSFTFRYALFDTKSFDSRLYAYETDLPGSYSIPSYYYKGSRTYVMFNYRITRNIQCWLRWSQTYYANKNVISPGALTEIQGNTKSEVKVQMMMGF